MNRLRDAIRLIRSKAYIFINDKLVTYAGDFSSEDKFSVLHSLTELKQNVTEALEHFENEHFKKKG